MARNNFSLTLHAWTRLVRYNPVEFSELREHQAVAEELHSSSVEGALCYRATDFALIPATVLPYWNIESKTSALKVALWKLRPKRVTRSKSSGTGSHLSNLAPT
jgi:hypothetical protein